MSERSKSQNPLANSALLFSPLARSDLDRNLVADFFFAFSRFEFALKRSGFVRRGRNDQAEPDWNRFAREIETAYGNEKSKKFLDARDYLLRNPPKRQVIVDDNKLEWRDLQRRDDSSEIEWLLVIVRMVRNNLFHGGKYPMTPVPEPARDTRLLRSSMTVLEWCLRNERTVQNWFKGKLD